MSDTIPVSKDFLEQLHKLLDKFDYEADEDSAAGAAFFEARLNEDWFFHLKFELEKLCK